jgi:hypothetical protein
MKTIEITTKKKNNPNLNVFIVHNPDSNNLSKIAASHMPFFL